MSERITVETQVWLVQFVVAVLSQWDAEFARLPRQDKVTEANWVLERANPASAFPPVSSSQENPVEGGD